MRLFSIVCSTLVACASSAFAQHSIFEDSPRLSAPTQATDPTTDLPGFLVMVDADPKLGLPAVVKIPMGERSSTP
jgi:hypothetical protein